jgi:hypothetical protein
MPIERIQRTICDACEKVHEQRVRSNSNIAPEGWFEVVVRILVGPNGQYYLPSGKKDDGEDPADVFACSWSCVRTLLDAVNAPEVR